MEKYFCKIGFCVVFSTFFCLFAAFLQMLNSWHMRGLTMNHMFTAVSADLPEVEISPIMDGQAVGRMCTYLARVIKQERFLKEAWNTRELYLMETN